MDRYTYTKNARFNVEFGYLGIQICEDENGERVVEVAFFEKADGLNGHGLSVIYMLANEGFSDEIISACVSFEPLDLVHVTFDIVLYREKSGCDGINRIRHIEAVNPREGKDLDSIHPVPAQLNK